jgi:hypothetical protein
MALEEVWHDNDECPIGRSIAPADRHPGAPPSLKRCSYCAMLDQQRKFRPPSPSEK